MYTKWTNGTINNQTKRTYVKKQSELNASNVDGYTNVVNNDINAYNCALNYDQNTWSPSCVKSHPTHTNVESYDGNGNDTKFKREDMYEQISQRDKVQQNCLNPFLQNNYVEHVSNESNYLTPINTSK